MGENMSDRHDIALAIPHTPWVPERVASMARLKEQLGHRPRFYREFTEKAANTVWAEELWTWLRDTGAEWCLQLQDDVMVAPCFWPALRAMLGALPPEADVVGLASVHPMAKEIARRGQHWYRTRGNLVGWAYMLRHEALTEFLEIRGKMSDDFRSQNEDEQIAEWVSKTGRTCWHPVPAIADHDTTIPSSYKNDDHTLRRPQITWRDYTDGSMTDPTWWMLSGTTEIMHLPNQFNCWWCGVNPTILKSQETGARLCAKCMGALMGHLLNQTMLARQI
jgi:hypothetical protein